MDPSTEEEFLGSLYKGGELLAAGKVDEAKSHLERAHDLRPKNEKAQNLLGLTYFKLGLFEGAARVYDLLVRDNPVDPTLRVNLGLVHLKTNALPLAIREFETATDLDPTHTKAHNYLGLALAQVGEYARARDHFIQAGSDAMAEKMARAQALKPGIPPQAIVIPPSAPRPVPPGVMSAPRDEEAIEVMSDEEMPPDTEQVQAEAPPPSSPVLGADWGAQAGGSMDDDAPPVISSGSLPPEAIEELPMMDDSDLVSVEAPAASTPSSPAWLTSQSQPSAPSTEPEWVTQNLGDLPLMSEPPQEGPPADVELGDFVSEQNQIPDDVEVEAVAEVAAVSYPDDTAPADPFRTAPTDPFGGGQDVDLSAEPETSGWGEPAQRADNDWSDAAAEQPQAEDQWANAAVEQPTEEPWADASVAQPEPPADEHWDDASAAQPEAAPRADDDWSDASPQAAATATDEWDNAVAQSDGGANQWGTPAPPEATWDAPEAEAEPSQLHHADESDVRPSAPVLDATVEEEPPQPEPQAPEVQAIVSSAVSHPPASAPHYSPMATRRLNDIGAASQQLAELSAGAFHLGADGLALTVRGELLARLEGLVAIVGSMDVKPEHRRYRGRPTAEGFGQGATQMQRVTGHGVLYLEPGRRTFHAFDLDEEGVYLREERVFAFEEPIAFENGRLAAEGGLAVDVLHLKGLGRVLLQLDGPLKAMPIPPGAPMVVPLARIVGWFGYVTPRLVGFAGQGALELTGDGYVLLSAGAA